MKTKGVLVALAVFGVLLIQRPHLLVVAAAAAGRPRIQGPGRRLGPARQVGEDQRRAYPAAPRKTQPAGAYSCGYQDEI